MLLAQLLGQHRPDPGRELGRADEVREHQAHRLEAHARDRRVRPPRVHPWAQGYRRRAGRVRLAYDLTPWRRAARRPRRHLGRRGGDALPHGEGRGAGRPAAAARAGRGGAGRRLPHRRAPAGPHRRRVAHRVRGRGRAAPPTPSIEVLELDATLSRAGGHLRARARWRPARRCSAACSPGPPPPRREFVRTLLTGGLRQGALAGVMTDAVAKAAGRAAAARAPRRDALGRPRAAPPRSRSREGADALEAVRLAVLQPDPADARRQRRPTSARRSSSPGPASVEWKLDGARVQVHRAGDEVRIYTRNLNEITERLPGIVALARTACRRRRSCSTARCSGGTRTPASRARSRTR